MLERVQACLLGVMLGDALGMPWETMTYKEIQDHTAWNGVTGFADPVQTRIKDTKDLGVGDTTDDWQLTKVVAESIINLGRFDRYNIALRHVKALKESPFGWGKTTENAINNIAAMINKAPHLFALKKSTFSTDPDPKNKGTGTGVAMKIAPVALYCCLRFGKDYQNSLVRHTIELGSLTHKDTRATVAAYALGVCIAECLLNPIPNSYRKKQKLCDLIINSVERVEQNLPCTCPPPSN